VFNKDGSKNEGWISILARTYPIAVAGNTAGYSFDPKSTWFWLNFTTTEITRTESTVVYLSEEYHYKNGYTAELLNGPKDWYSIDTSTPNYVRIQGRHDIPLDYFSIFLIREKGTESVEVTAE
jgi:hypothetical protein